MIYLYLVSLSFSFSLVLLLSIYLNYRQSSLMLFHTKYNFCEHCRENGMFCGLYLFYIFDEISPHLLHPSVQNAKRGFYFSITLSVKLLLSVAYSPSVTWLFLFNSFVGQAYKWERVPCPLILFLWADKLVLLVYIYNAKAFFLPLENKGKDILSPEGRFYFSVSISSSTDT